MEHSDQTGGREPLILSDKPSFENVLDDTCGRLWDKKIQHSMRRIRELQDNLSGLEHELDALIPGKDHDAP
jgi:hypothetical protein